MLINKDITVLHINNLEDRMVPYPLEDKEAILKIVEIINKASKVPAKFKAKLQLELEGIDDKILVNGYFFKYKGITYQTHLDFEKWLNKLINE